MKELITGFIDFFYPPFRRFMPLQTFRYIVCGGGNTVLDIVLYWFCYNYVFDKELVHTPLVVIKPHIAAFMVAFVISFPTGFYLNRTIVFTGSTLRGRVQLFRYFMLVVICILLNYVCLTVFVDKFGIYPTVAKIFTTFVVVCFSYLTQKKFTFKIDKPSDPVL